MKYISTNIWNGHEEHVKFVNKLKGGDFDKAIFFAHNEWDHWSAIKDMLDEINEALVKFNKTLYITTASAKLTDFDFSFPNIKVISWSTHWIIRAVEGLNNYGKMGRQYKLNIDELQYLKHYISLNNRPHYWRCELIDLLAKHNLIEHGYVSWHHDRETMYEFKYFNQRKLFLSDNFEIDKEQYVLPTEYKYAFAQLVSESTPETLCISEKTATALLAGKPFLVATAPNFHAFLQELGFQLYNEIFDYSFDTIEDATQRYEKLLENFKRLCDIPISELTKLNDLVRDKVKFNQELAEKIAFDRTLYPEIVLEITNLYRQTGELVDDWVCYTDTRMETIKQNLINTV